MRKIIFFTIALAQISFVVAQSLVVTGDGAFTSSNGNIFFFHQENITNEISHNLDIKNISANAITVKCKKTILFSGPNSAAESYYCFAGACYAANFTGASNSAVIAAGQQISFDNSPPDADSFSGYYNPYGTQSIGEVQYCFYNQNNPSDSTCVIINYACFAVAGINDFTKVTKMSDFYPNPTNSVTNFTFKGSKAQLKIIDILGNEVKALQLEQSGIKSIDLTNMNNGIYFGKLVLDNQVTTIKKLIIN